MMRDRMKRKVLGKVLESGGIDSMTYTLAAAENELLETARDLEEAHGIENISGGDLPSIEDRQAALKELLRALVNDEMDEVWLEEIAPDLLDDPERAEQYMEMGANEWHEQINRWADAYREAAPDLSDRELAAHHVRETFGVDLETFEDRVVNWNAGEEAERLFAGNLRAVRETMQQATEAAEQRQYELREANERASMARSGE